MLKDPHIKATQGALAERLKTSIGRLEKFMVTLRAHLSVEPAGADPRERERCLLDDALAVTCALVQARGLDKNIDIAIEPELRAKTSAASHATMIHELDNLNSNACKSLKDGAAPAACVKIGLAKRAKLAEKFARVSDDFLIMHVSDNASGLSRQAFLTLSGEQSGEGDSVRGRRRSHGLRLIRKLIEADGGLFDAVSLSPEMGELAG